MEGFVRTSGSGEAAQLNAERRRLLAAAAAKPVHIVAMTGASRRAG